jgi:hypothetical protein
LLIVDYNLSYGFSALLPRYIGTFSQIYDIPTLSKMMRKIPGQNKEKLSQDTPYAAIENSTE